MSVSTTSSNSANLHVFYSKKWLDTLQPKLAFYPLGEKTSLPKGGGTQAKWLRYTRLAGSTTALTEGTTPQEGSFTTANVTATIAQYGAYTKVSDLLDMTAIDPVIENLTNLFGEAAAETIELLIAAEEDSTGTNQYANGVGALNSVTATDVPTMKEFIKASLTQRKNLVGPHAMGAFMVVLNPSHKYDLITEQNLGGWLDINQYSLADQKNIQSSEFGKAYGMRFLESDRCTSAVNSGSVTVWNSYVHGARPFGVVELGGKNFELIVKDSKSGGVSNPLELISTVGYKIPGFAVKTLDASTIRCTLVRGATAL